VIILWKSDDTYSFILKDRYWLKGWIVGVSPYRNTICNKRVYNEIIKLNEHLSGNIMSDFREYTNTFWDFLPKSWICIFQFRWESRIIPKYLIQESCLITLLQIFNSILDVRRFWWGWKITKLVLSMLKDSLLAHNQLLTLISSRFTVHSSSESFLLFKNKFVSSAKR